MSDTSRPIEMTHLHVVDTATLAGLVGQKDKEIAALHAKLAEVEQIVERWASGKIGHYNALQQIQQRLAVGGE
jgi:hypothetical protein